MNIEAIKTNDLIKTIFEYIKVEFKLNKKTVSYKFNSYKGFEHSGKYDISLVENISDDKDKKITICKKWFFENITNNLAVIEVLVNGHYTYYHRYNFDYTKLEITKMSDFSIKFSHKSNFLEKEGDTFVFEGKDIKDLYSTVLKLGELLHIGGYPLSMLHNEYSSYDELLAISYKDKPEVYKTIYRENELGQKAIKNYPNTKSEKAKSFWREILNRDYMLKNHNNPLHKERENELKIFAYSVEGECYKNDGYETWRSDIDHTFISNKKLDINKLKSVYENEYGDEIEHIISLNVSEIEYSGYINNNNITFIEVDEKESENRYITRPANYRFNELKYS